MRMARLQPGRSSVRLLCGPSSRAAFATLALIAVHCGRKPSARDSQAPREDVPTAIRNVSFSEDGRFLFLWGTDEVLRKLHLATGELQTIDTPSLGAWGEISSNGEFGAEREHRRLIDFTSREAFPVDPDAVTPYDIDIAGFTNHPPELVLYDRRSYTWFRRDPRSRKVTWHLDEPGVVPLSPGFDWFRSRRFLWINGRNLLDVERGRWVPLGSVYPASANFVLDDDELGFFHSRKENDGFLVDMRSLRTRDLRVQGRLVSLSMARERAWTISGDVLRETDLSEEVRPVWEVHLGPTHSVVRPVHSKWIFLCRYQDRVEVLDSETRSLRAIGPRIDHRPSDRPFFASTDGKYVLHISGRLIEVFWVDEVKTEEPRCLSVEIPPSRGPAR